MNDPVQTLVQVESMGRAVIASLETVILTPYETAPPEVHTALLGTQIMVKALRKLLDQHDGEVEAWLDKQIAPRSDDAK